MAEKVHVRRHGKPVEVFKVSPWGVLPLDEIGDRFKLFRPAKLFVGERDRVDGLTSIVEIRRRFGRDVGTASDPLFASGYTGPYHVGFKANFLDAAGGKFPCEILQELHYSASTAVYKVKAKGQDMALKVVLENKCKYPWAGSAEPSFFQDLIKLAHAGHAEEGHAEEKGQSSFSEENQAASFRCPSLPQLVDMGWLMASGFDSPSCDAVAMLMKPVGRCVRDMGIQQNAVLLCKAGYDILLALYTLHLIERRHGAVKPENMIYVEESNQFVLIDFKDPPDVVIPGDIPDCAGLVLSLAFMWSGQTLDYVVAARLLATVSPVLGSFARYVATLSVASVPCFDTWIAQLAAACSVDEAPLLVEAMRSLQLSLRQ